MKKKTDRMSPPGLNRRVDAHDSLGYGSGYWSGLLIIMVVKFTHQLGKKFPREDLHPAGIGHLRGHPAPFTILAYKRSSLREAMPAIDRKSTRLNSSHITNSYAV